MDDNSDRFSQLYQQYIYILNEFESKFFIKSIFFPDLSDKTNRILLTIAILKQGGYIPDDLPSPDSFNASIRNNSISYFYKKSSFNIRNHLVFQSSWHQSKSGHWTYLVK